MTITAKNIGRINVWPTYDTAREADTAESKFIGQLTVWQTNEEARANISHEEEGGGGGAPAWVPANAVIHIDLVGGTPQGRAWVEGVGEVAVDTLLGNDPNADSGWGSVTGYNPASLTSDGYVSATMPVAYIGAARTAICGAPGFTMRMQTKQVGIHDNHAVLALVSTDGNDTVAFNGNLDRRFRATSWNGPLSLAVIDALNIGAGALNGFAMTLVPGRADIAANGLAAVTGVVDSSDRPAGNPLTAAITLGLANYAFQSITLYDPLPDTTGLSDLSEVT